MMDWNEARKETIRFMRSTLGSGYIAEYYESFADELLNILKMIEQPDPVATPDDDNETPDDERPSNAEIAESLEAHATLLASLARRVRR